MNEARTIHPESSSILPMRSACSIGYPWVVVCKSSKAAISAAPAELTLPPVSQVSVCGRIYGRSIVDVERKGGEFIKAPANEELCGGHPVETAINFCSTRVLRSFGELIVWRFWPPVEGYRVWGARTIGSDSNWSMSAFAVASSVIYRSIPIDRSTHKI
jgi:phage tail sheath protein FI